MSRRCSATRRAGSPGRCSIASRPSGRVSAISPSLVSKTTAVTPGPPDTRFSNGAPSRTDSQDAIRSALGLPRSASTRPPRIVPCGWSSVAASSDRQGVARVQLRSVSPGL